MTDENGANGEAEDAERELVALARGGDRLAMRRLVERHQSNVYHLALGMLGSPADAEDAVQEVFIKVLKSLRGFRQEARLSTWLYVVTGNVCREQLRRRRRSVVALQSADVEDSDDGPADSSTAAEPAAALALGDAQRELLAALQTLSFAERQVVTLRKFRELSVRETAQVLGIAEGTVKALLFRALDKLRRTLGVADAP